MEPTSRLATIVLVVGLALLPGCASGSAGSAGARRSGGDAASAVPVPSTTLRLPPPPEGGFDPPVQVVIEGAPTLTADVARRPDQRARGLMQRPSLAENTGMVFLFPERTRSGFYMLGTLIPLSIAYVDGDRVVNTAEMTPCRRQVCRTYAPIGPYTMAVEAPGGFFPKYGVTRGSTVRIVGKTAPPV